MFSCVLDFAIEMADWSNIADLSVLSALNLLFAFVFDSSFSLPPVAVHDVLLFRFTINLELVFLLLFFLEVAAAIIPWSDTLRSSFPLRFVFAHDSTLLGEVLFLNCFSVPVAELAKDGPLLAVSSFSCWLNRVLRLRTGFAQSALSCSTFVSLHPITVCWSLIVPPTIDCILSALKLKIYSALSMSKDVNKVTGTSLADGSSNKSIESVDDGVVGTRLHCVLCTSLLRASSTDLRRFGVYTLTHLPTVLGTSVLLPVQSLLACGRQDRDSSFVAVRSRSFTSRERSQHCSYKIGFKSGLSRHVSSLLLIMHLVCTWFTLSTSADAALITVAPAPTSVLVPVLVSVSVSVSVLVLVLVVVVIVIALLVVVVVVVAVVVVTVVVIVLARVVAVVVSRCVLIFMADGESVESDEFTMFPLLTSVGTDSSYKACSESCSLPSIMSMLSEYRCLFELISLLLLPAQSDVFSSMLSLSHLTRT